MRPANKNYPIHNTTRNRQSKI